MRVTDARRLTGKNLWTTGPAAAAEIVLEAGDDVDALTAAVRREVPPLFQALGLSDEGLVFRTHKSGLSVALPVVIDALYAGVSALELAIERAAASLRGSADNVTPDDEETLRAISEELAAERNPSLIKLLSAAHERGVPALWDDDEVSLGLGARSRTFPVRELPSPADVPWSDLGVIPVAIVTGTNGKTTTTRLLARMLGAGGLMAGHTSTDGLVVGGDVVDGGDWSGPGGARMLLRQRSVQAAVLETARGGLLRRGLAVERCDVALVTNVGDDHLGEYGVHDVATMADVKLLVARALDDGGTLVLNAEDELLLFRAKRTLGSERTFKQVLFSRDPASDVLEAHVKGGGVAWCLDDGCLVRREGDEGRRLLPVDEVPLAYGGAAVHNVENALAAAAVGDALGLPFEALAGGLRSLLPTPKDSPGRSNVLMKDGLRLLLDFAHNPAGVAMTMSFVAALRERDVERGRLLVIVGQAGDRSDDEVRAFARGVREGGADVVIARDLGSYLRGREPGETPALFRDELLRHGMAASSVHLAGDDVAALTLALDLAQRGDTVALLVQVDTEGVHALLLQRGWSLDEVAA